MGLCLVAARRITVACTAALLLCLSAILAAQELRSSRPADPAHGRALYQQGCIVCHGANGRGAPETSTEFKRPDTFPDFSQCSGTTPEPNYTWKAVITNGGPYLGFSTIMPAFGQLLSSDDIDDLVAYLRTFCADNTRWHWPRGELNLPRAIVTEKAFPEDEFVLTSAANATGAPGYTTHFIHEESFGPFDQVEVDVPWVYDDQNHHYDSHVGDMTFGLKHVVYSNLHTGSILSLQGGVLPPTGSQKLGGAGTTVFEPFAAFDQLFRTNTWFQLQMGADLPRHPNITPQSLFGYAAIGQTIAADHRLGRQWSPMVEFLANRDLTDSAKTDWDVLPEMQVTVSPRQHIRVDVGYRQPFTDTGGRQGQIEFYVLWDWADGKFWEGW